MHTTLNSFRPYLKAALLGALLTLGASAWSQGQSGSHGKGKNKQAAATQPAAAASQPVPAAVTLPANPYLTETQRKIILDHYASQQKRSGHCPPGLAKKNNGCMPPGQAKKWAMGQPLPANVAHQPLPEAVLKKIGVVEKGVEIVRILNDVVVLRKSNRTVLDAVEILQPR